MEGILLCYGYRNEDDIERSKTASEWKQEYNIQYYLVNEWYISLFVTILYRTKAY